MKVVLIYMLVIFSFYSSASNARVWESHQTWDQKWEDEYQRWVITNLSRSIFKNDGLLEGLATDCADALYAIRIQFAYENSLPFVINAPDVLSSKMKLFGSESSMFDNITNERARVRAFIDYVGDEVGTINLQKDTFPVNIKEINAGTIYLVEWQLFGMGKVNKHSYIIKGFDDDNELIYYYSDAPRKIRTLDVNVKYPRFSFDSAPYGYRKWKQPQHLLIPEKAIPTEDGYSTEQYRLVNLVGKKNILKEIRSRLRN